MNGGEIVARVLHAHGVPFLFTLCGGHISPILVACRARGLRVIDTRHEATAVFAADAVGRLSGVPGVAAVTAGPGVSNTLTALQNARLAQSPLVLLGGATATVLRGRGALQDIDQLALVRSSVKWAARVTRLRELEPKLREALRVSMQGTPGPVFLECPVDLLYEETLVRQWYAGRTTPRKGASLAERALATWLRWHLDRQFAGVTTTGTPEPLPAVGPVDTAAVDETRARLQRAQRPLLLIGSQALLDAGAAEALAEAVAALNLPVYLSGMARGLLGREHPLLMRHSRREALREADLVILAGVPCDFRLDYGAHIRRASPVIAINRNRRDRYLNRRPQLAVAGDAGAFLRALAGSVSTPPDWSAWRASLRARNNARETAIDAQAMAPGAAVNPLALCRAIDAQLRDDSVLVADGGDFVATASYVVHPVAPLRWLDPGVFGTLGVGAGFALGAALCRPGAQVWMLFGDGAFGYSLTEFDTFVRHGIAPIAVIGNDACWSQIAREQLPVLGDAVGCTLRHSDYHLAAAGLGAAALLLREDGAIANTLAEARRLAASGKPVVVNAWLQDSDFRQGSVSI